LWVFFVGLPHEPCVAPHGVIRLGPDPCKSVINEQGKIGILTVRVLSGSQCWLPNPATIVEMIKGCLHRRPTILALASDADNAYVQACHHQPAKTNAARVAQPATHDCLRKSNHAGWGLGPRPSSGLCNSQKHFFRPLSSHMHCCLPCRTGCVQAVSYLGWPSSSTAANSAAVSILMISWHEIHLKMLLLRRNAV